MQDGRVNLVADGVYSLPQAEAFCGLKRTTLYKAMNAGELEWVTVGRRRLIPRRALQEFLAARVRGGWAKASTADVGSDPGYWEHRPIGTVT